MIIKGFMSLNAAACAHAVHSSRAPARLLSATAIERMAVVSGVTVVPNARIAGVALTDVHGDKTVAAMSKTLELNGGKRVLRKQGGRRAHKSDEPLFHTFPHALMRRIVQR